MSKLRDFWITVHEGITTHIALFEKRDDREQIHVREVVEVSDAEIEAYALTFIPEARLGIKAGARWMKTKMGGGECN